MHIYGIDLKPWYRWLPLVVAFFLFYHHAVDTLISDWNTDPNFSHGFLIPFISIYMVWYKKNELRLMEPRPSSWGLLFIFAGMGTHFIGTIGAELFLLRFSIIFTLAGILIYGFGFNIFKVLWLPVVYLILMIPIPAIIWNKIAFPLQLMAAKLASHIIMLITIPVYREGNILHLANTSLEVVDACSGLRSLTSLIALSTIFAYLAPISSLKKWILFFSAIPIAVTVNVIRLSITAGMAYWISPETAHGFLHDMSGLIIFGLALFLIYVVFLGLLRWEKRQAKDG